MYVYTYIYIYRERERQRDRVRLRSKVGPPSRKLSLYKNQASCLGQWSAAFFMQIRRKIEENDKP